MTIWPRLVFLAAAPVLFLASCSDSNPVDPPPVVTRIEVTALSSTTIVGTAFTVTARVIAQDGSLIVDRAVDWVSSNPNLATVTSTGNLTGSVLPVGVGTFVISAKLDGKAGSVSFTGNPPAPVPARAFLWSEAEGFTVIPLPAGASSAHAAAINSTGAVVGLARFTNQNRPFLWTRARGTIDLGLLPGALTCSASAISDAEEVVGDCSDSNAGYPRVFRWTAASGMTQLSVPAGALGGNATGVNSAGEVSGAVFTIVGNDVVGRPARWDRAGAYEALQLPSGATQGYPLAINDAGTMVGWVAETDYYAPVSAALWRRGTASAEVFDACLQYGCYSYPRAISQNGRVTGFRQGRAYSWSRDNGFIPITAPTGAGFSEGVGIDNDGRVAVNSYFGGVVRGSLVTLTGTAREIPPPPGTSSMELRGLNSAGQVALTAR